MCADDELRPYLFLFIHITGKLFHLVMAISIIFNRPFQNGIYCLDITRTSQEWTLCLPGPSHVNRSIGLNRCADWSLYQVGGIV